MRIAVAGASGYVGSRLVPRLAAAGHDVLALARSVDGTRPGARVYPLTVDLADEQSVGEVLVGVDVAVYLVHSMAAGSDFASRDRELAATFADAAAAAGVRRIVYLGGLGRGDLSEHLASRHEVGAVLASGPVPVVELRAAVILGSGSISFEMIRYLTERLPAMICPRWIHTRIQPIAEVDLLAHLERALEEDVVPGVYEVGGPEITTYRDMMAAYARVRGLRRRPILDVPMLTPRLSARWVDFVTPVDRHVSHTLIESLGTEVVVADAGRTRAAFEIEGLDVDAAIARALADQVAALPDRLFDPPSDIAEGIYAMREDARVGRDDLVAVRTGLQACGGDLSWYGLAGAWRMRIALGRLFGERLRLHRPREVEAGARVDWWTAVRVEPSTLVLATDQWFCGEAWLGYRVEPPESDGGDARLTQVGAFRPLGLLGVVYWRLMWPIHLVVFELMAKRQTRVKKAAAEGGSARG